VVVVVLSLGADEVLHLLKVYPPWGVPMYEPGLNLLALTYRSVFTFIGGYVTARLAPHSPMRHVLVGCASASCSDRSGSSLGRRQSWGRSGTPWPLRSPGRCSTGSVAGFS
jgi:hypothetical protein